MRMLSHLGQIRFGAIITFFRYIRPIRSIRVIRVRLLIWGGSSPCPRASVVK